MNTEDFFILYYANGIKRNWSLAHARNIKYRLVPLIEQFGQRPLDGISADDMSELFIKTFGHYAGKSWNSTAADYKAFFNNAVANGVIDASPMTLVQRRRERNRMKTPPRRDFKKLRDVAMDWSVNGNKYQIRDAAIWFMSADTGARLRELTELKKTEMVAALREPLHFADGKVYALEIDGKTDYGWISWSTETAAALNRYLGVRPKRPGHNGLWCSFRKRDKYGQMTESGVGDAFEHIAAEAGVGRNFRSHALRYFNAYYYAEKFGIKAAQAKLRHSDPAFTQRVYVQLSQQQLMRHTAQAALLSRTF